MPKPPPTLKDPTGQCRTCRFCITDRTEVLAEFKLKATQRPLLYTAARAGGEEVRPELLMISLGQIVEQRLGIPLENIGLCEKGVADFVDAVHAGRAVDHEGTRIDPCPHWQSNAGFISTIRSAFWRLDRNAENRKRVTEATAMAHDMRQIGPAGATEIRPDDPCPCGSGRILNACCKKPRFL